MAILSNCVAKISQWTVGGITTAEAVWLISSLKNGGSHQHIFWRVVSSSRI